MARSVKKEKTKPIEVKTRNKFTLLWFSCVIAVLSVILYINTLQNSYTLDDKGIITENKFTSSGFSGIPRLLTTSYWEGVGINVRSYRPLAPVTFAAEVGIWGKNPMVSHFFNLLIYMMTGVLLLFFLKRLFGKIDPDIPLMIPFIIVILFLAHPIHTEVVANIKGRDSMFEFFFLVLSAYFLFKYLETYKKADLVMSVLSFFPALLSKESAITFFVMVPVVLILFDNRSIAQKVVITLLYIIPVGLFLLLYLNFSDFQGFKQLHILDNALIVNAPSGEIWATKFLILGKYLALLIFPHPLVFDYSYNQIPMTNLSSPLVWLSIFIYFSITVFLVYILQKRLAGKTVSAGALVFAFSIAWFFMGFFASSNLVMLIGSTMGERFMYSPSLGFVIILVYGLYKIVLFAQKSKQAGKTTAIILYLFCAILLVPYLLKTIDRNKAWKNDFTLYSTDLRYLGENVKANDFLANLYRKDGDKATDPAVKNDCYKRAIELKEKAIKIYPKVPEIQQQLAFLYGNTGQFEKAIETYKVAIELNPGEILNYIQIGKAYGMINRIRDGLPYLQKAEKINPDNADLVSTLGITYANTGDADRAIVYFEKTLAKDPSNKQIADYLAFIKNQQKPKK